ncbi:MAG: hypothetical protein AAB115_08480, partial [Pseudomonadota bacterium]
VDSMSKPNFPAVFMNLLQRRMLPADMNPAALRASARRFSACILQENARARKEVYRARDTAPPFG